MPETDFSGPQHFSFGRVAVVARPLKAVISVPCSIQIVQSIRARICSYFFEGFAFTIELLYVLGEKKKVTCKKCTGRLHNPFWCDILLWIQIDIREKNNEKWNHLQANTLLFKFLT